LISQYWQNKQNFRKYAWEEAKKFSKYNFLKSAQTLLPEIRENNLVSCSKVGIRPQLINNKTNEMVMDFVVGRGIRSIHVLNAISPAFTCSFSFAKLITENL
jgi:hypothetical protein